MNGESSEETHTLLYVEQTASGSLLNDSGNSKQALRQPGGVGCGGNWGGGRRFKREGTYVYPWLIHVDVWQKPEQYCKASIFH